MLLHQVKDLWLWCMRNIFLQAQHLPGAVNTIATVSQGCGQTNQKELSLRFFQLINAQLSSLLVDLQDDAYEIFCTVGFMQYNIKGLPTKMMTHGTSKQNILTLPGEAASQLVRT